MKKILLSIGLLTGIVGFSQVPTNGLIDFYPFSGNANDASGNSYHGTNHGATLVSDRFGNANAAYNFLSGGYIDCNDILDGTFASSSKKFSISFWVKPDIANSNAMILAKHSDLACSTDERQFFIRKLNNQINVEYYGNNAGTIGRFICGSSTLENYSKWYHVAVIYDGNINTNDGLDRVLIYVDNKLETSSFCRQPVGNFPFDIPVGAAHFGIGNYLNTTGTPCDQSRNYKGSIDDLRIYDRVLTGTEIDQLYHENICFQTVTVTDTLIIKTNITGFNPLTYQNTIKIYPNPTKDKVTIDFGDYAKLTGYKLRIDNSLGQKVYETSISMQQTVLDLKNWSGKGVYFVYTIDEKGHAVDVKKIVLQ